MDIILDKKNRGHRLAKNGVMLACFFFFCLLSGALIIFNREKEIRVPLNHIRLHPVLQGAFTDRLITRAVAIPSESVIVTAEHSGTVIDIRQSLSNDVKKGEIVARLSNEDFELHIATRLAETTEKINHLRNLRRILDKDKFDSSLARQDAHFKVEKCRKDLVRKKVLYERGILERATYEKLLDELAHWKEREQILMNYQDKKRIALAAQYTEIDSALAHLEQLVSRIKKSLEQLVITAPIDGTLSPLMIKKGQQLKAGERVASVDNFQSYYFEAAFSEYYLDKINIHDQAAAHYAGKDIPLAIISVSSRVENGKFTARLGLKNPEPLQLKSGQSVDVQLFLKHASDALHIPSEAVLREQDQAWVYLYDKVKSQAIKTPVIIQRQGDTTTEIVSGLSAGQQIVTFLERQMIKSDIIGLD